MKLTQENFTEWLEKATIENNDGYDIFTGYYENCITVDTENYNGWKITQSPFDLTKEQVEKVFDVLDEYLTPEDEGEELDDIYTCGVHTVLPY